MLPVAVIRASVLAEADTFWQIRTGQLILDSRHIPAVDTLSWWAYGRHWAPDSWGFDLVLALAYRTGGLGLVACAGAAAVFFMAAAVLLFARRLGASSVVTYVLLTAWMLVAIAWLSARPQLADYLAVPLVLLVAGDSAVEGRLPVRRLACIALIFAVWVNLHAAAPIGVVVLLAHGAAGWLRDLVNRQLGTRRKQLSAVLPALAGSMGLMVNPQGLGLIHQVRVTAFSSAGLVAEWGHLYPGDVRQLLMLGTGLLGIMVASQRRRWDLAGVLAVLIIGSMLFIRLLPILDVVAIPILAAGLSQYMRGREWRHRLRAAAVGLGGVIAVEAAGDIPRIGHTSFPLYLVGALPSGCRLFNEYLLGGSVILLRPDVPVSLDSRNDLYGRDDVAFQQQLLSDAQGGVDTLNRLAVNCVLIPASSGLAGQLSISAEWELRQRVPGVALFIRRSTV